MLTRHDAIGHTNTELLAMAREAKGDALLLSKGNLSIFNPASEAAKLSRLSFDIMRILRGRYCFEVI